MSADLLRQAAATLRERAEDAAPGVWDVDDMIDENVIAYDMTDDGFDDDTTDVARVEDADSALYIATMHPGVGLALADWLDAAATSYEVMEGVTGIDSALDLARLIVGHS